MIEFNFLVLKDLINWERLLSLPVLFICGFFGLAYSKLILKIFFEYIPNGLSKLKQFAFSNKKEQGKVKSK